MPDMKERIKDDLLSGEKNLWTALTSGRPGEALQKMLDDEVCLTPEDSTCFFRP